MLKSFLLSSIRHILKKAWISGLNIFCLSLGGAICIFVFNYRTFEKGYDNSFNDSSTYRLERHVAAPGGPTTKDALTPVLWEPFLHKHLKVSGVSTRIVPYTEERNAFFEQISSEQERDRKTLHFKNVYYIEPSILDIFPFQWTNSPSFGADSTVVFLSKSAAKQVLAIDESGENTGNLILQAIQNNGLPSPNYKLGGVFEDFPVNSNLAMDVLVFSRQHDHIFNNTNLAYTYITTDEPLSFEQRSIVDDSFIAGESLYLRPVTSIHFAKGISNNSKPIGNELMLLFLTVVGVIIMLLSITNYTVSSIFGTIDRMREVGVRKLLGMRPSHLIANFITESFLIHLLSGVFALAMFQYLSNNGLPFMPDQKTIGTGNPLDFQAINAAGVGQTIVFTVLLFLSSALLSSLYPALYFNRIRPVFLLKGRLQILNSGLLKGANSVVKTLIIFQLTSSVLFLSGLMMTNQALVKANQKEVYPYDLQVRGIFPGIAGANETFKQMASSSISDLKQKELVRDIEYSNLYRNQVQTRGKIIVRTGSRSQDSELQLIVTDHSHWADTSSFLAGQNFSPDFGSDPHHIILNETALDLVGIKFPNGAIGDSLYSTDMGKFKIIGVTKNIKKEPTAFVSGFRYRTFLELTLHFDQGISRSKDVYSFVRSAEINLSSAFPRVNLLKREFQKEQLIGRSMNIMFLIFSLLALIITAFGLLNLSSFIVEKRGKEIDIRKLLGAQKMNLIQIMSSDLLRLVIAASIIAAPIIYLTIQFGLNQYSNGIDVSPLFISVPAVTVLFLALLVAIPKCWQQANSNLSQSLGRK